MPANKKPRKAHKPRLVLNNPLKHILNRVKVLDHDYTLTCAIRHATTLKQMIEGKGTYYDWGAICGALNMSCILCSMDIGKEHFDLLERAQTLHTLCGRRYREAGGHEPFGYLPSEVETLREAIEVYDAQLAVVNLQEFDKAAWKLEQHIKSGRLNTRAVDKRLEASTLLPV